MSPFPALLLWCGLTVLGAADLWVAADGLPGGAGTAMSPVDLATAAATAVPGTVVRLQAGVYAQRLVVGVSGSAGGGPVTFRGEDGAVIDGTGVPIPAGDWTGLIEIDGHSYIRIENLEVRGWQTGTASLTPAGILVRSLTGPVVGIELVGNHVHGIWQVSGRSGAHGIAVYGKHATPISDLIIAGNEVDHCRLAWSEAMVVNGNVDGFTIAGNRVHHVNNIGIDVIGWEGEAPVDDQPRNGVVRGNTVSVVHADGYGEVDSRNLAYGRNDDAADGIYVDGARDILVERNTVWDCDICYEVGAEHGPLGATERNSTRITVRDNGGWQAKQGVLMFGGYAANLGWAEDCLFTGNTLFDADRNDWSLGVIVVQKSRNCTITGNIVVATGTGRYVISSAIAAGPGNTGNISDWNLFQAAGGEPLFQLTSGTVSTGLDAHRIASGQDAGSLVADPAFIATTGVVDLHLGAGSPAIDRGDPGAVAGLRLDVDGAARVADGRIDIGADERPAAGTSPGVISFASIAMTQSEGDAGSATATIAVGRSGGTSGAVGVSWRTEDGSATAGSDYTAASGTLQWADGVGGVQTFTLTVHADTVFEGDETIGLGLSESTGGATLPTQTGAVLSIIEDDPAPPGGPSSSASSSGSGGGGGCSAGGLAGLLVAAGLAVTALVGRRAAASR